MGRPKLDMSDLSPVKTDATLLVNNSQNCWMLHVASVCTPCCMLLGVVGSCCAQSEIESPTLNFFFGPVIAEGSAAMLDPLAKLFQH